MRPPFVQHSYRAISFGDADHDTSVPAPSQKTKQQHNFKPIPLRLPFLITFILMFVTSLVLIELLLRSSVDVATSSASSSASTSTQALKMHRPKRQYTTNKALPRSEPGLDCSNPDTFPSRIAVEQASTASLCVVFTSSYAAYTKNLSYPQQTGLQQWLDSFSSASVAVNFLKGSSEVCATQQSSGTPQGTSTKDSAGAGGDGVTGVQVGCGTSTVTNKYGSDCIAAGLLWISNFQLQSAVSIVCAATRNNELVISSTPPTSTAPSAPSKNNELLTASAIKNSKLLTASAIVPAPAAAPTSPNPTVTQQAVPESGTTAPQSDMTTLLIVAPVPSTVEATIPKGQLPPVAVSVETGAQVVTFPTTDSNGHVQTVTATAAAVPVAGTYLTTNPNWQVQTSVSTAAATLPATYTYMTTKANGQVQTVVSTAASTVPGAYVYITTNSNGEVHTMMTQISDRLAALQTVVITNSLGQTETLVAPASALIPVVTTYTTADAQGHTQAVTASAYAIAGPLSTFTITDARGQVETIVSKISSANLPTTTKAKPDFVISSQEKITKTKFTYGTYVLALYLPAILAVIVKATWEMVFSAIKLIQPFERMASAPTSGEYSIFAQYLSSSLSWDAFTSLAQGNPVPLLASVLYILVTVGAPVAAASMTVKARNYCDVNGVQRRCDPVWVVNIALLRGVEVALVVCACLLLLILRSVTKNKSGIASDPSSLASLASLMTYEPLLHDFQRIDPDADCENFKHAMAQHRLLLEYHKTPQGHLSYGIIGLRNTKHDFDLPELESNRSSSNAYISSTKGEYNYHSIPNPSTSSSTGATFLHRARNHLLLDTLGLLLPLTLFTLVLTWYYDNNDDPLNNFFNSNTPWPKFLLVALATLSALHLSHLERVVRITEPFRRLAANSASNSSLRYKPSPAETTLLISRSGTPYSNLLYCISLLLSQDILRRRSGRMSLQSLVTITAVLADLNIIAAAGVAFNDAQTWQVYQVSSIASITLSGWIVLVYLVILLWWRRCESVRAVSEDAMGVSVGVGTVGGAMRWLLSGRNDRNVLETIANVKEKADGRKRKWRNVDTEYRGREEMDAGGTNIWFGKMGVVGANGLQRWGFGVHGDSEVQERTWMNKGIHGKRAMSHGGQLEYAGPHARSEEVWKERVSGEEDTLGQDASWRGGRFPSLSARYAPQNGRVSRGDEWPWNADGDLGTRNRII